MAIYHCHSTVGSKKRGQSARAKYDYVTRTGAYSKDRAEVVDTHSGNMPMWAYQDPAKYWSATDTYERQNGLVFRQIEFALPIELTKEQGRDLALGFARRVANSDRLPFSFAIHAGKGVNPHVHLILSERINDGIERPADQWFRRFNRKDPAAGGAEKADIGGRRKAWLEEIRKAWADHANLALGRADVDVRIDHRSYAERGIDEIPQVHLGPGAAAMEKKGIATERGDRFREVHQVNQQLAELRAIQAEAQEISLAPADPPRAWFAKLKKPAADPPPPQERKEMAIDRTKAAVQRQLKGMGCNFYEVGIRSAKGMMTREWTAKEIEKAVPWLKQQNALGADIYIRPSSAPGRDVNLVLVDDLVAGEIEKMQVRGDQPAVITQTSPQNFQAWIKLDAPTGPEIRTGVARLLAAEYAGDSASADHKHFGRLAGFTNRKPARRDATGKAPFVLLDSYAGRPADNSRQRTQEARRAAQERQERLAAIQATQPYREGGKTDLVTVYRRKARHLIEQYDEPDLSRVDWMICRDFARAGRSEDEIVVALIEASPDLAGRKDGHAEDYARRTARKALAEAPEAPTKATGPKPRP